MQAWFDLSEVFTDNLQPSARLSLIVDVHVSSHPGARDQVYEFRARNPSEVCVEQDGAPRLENFLHKTWDKRLIAARYLARQTLAKMPYVPVPVRMKAPEDDDIQFWWSYVVPYFDARRCFFDYLSHDLGELRFLWKTSRLGIVFLGVGAPRRLFDYGRKETGPAWQSLRLSRVLYGVPPLAPACATESFKCD